MPCWTSRASVDSRTSCRIEHFLRRHDGEYREMSVRAVPLLDARGNVREWVGVHTDITEQCNAERAATAAKEAAERTLETKRRFLAAINHDLRQPVQGLLLFHSCLHELLGSEAGAAANLLRGAEQSAHALK